MKEKKFNRCVASIYADSSKLNKVVDLEAMANLRHPDREQGFIGNVYCKFNELSPDRRCHVNNDGDCSNCQFYEARW